MHFFADAFLADAFFCRCIFTTSVIALVVVGAGVFCCLFSISYYRTYQRFLAATYPYRLGFYEAMNVLSKLAKNF